MPERGSGDNNLSSLPVVTASGASDGVPSDNTEDEDWSRGKKLLPNFLNSSLNDFILFFTP